MNDLINNIDIARMLEHLFGDFHGVHFFLKDLDSKHLMVSEQLLHSIGLTSEELIGKTDREVYNASLSEKYRQDDLKVLRSGEPLLGIIELFFNEQGVPAWHATNKYPVFDRAGKVIGVMGTITKIGSHFTDYKGHFSLVPALEYIEKNYNKNITIEALADTCSMSVRSLQRTFQKHFLTTPKKFIIKRRCYEACFLLKNHRFELSEVAQEVGFYDQSSFSKQFQAVMHITPREYRQRYE